MGNASPTKEGYNRGGGGTQKRDRQYGQGLLGSPSLGHYGGYCQEPFGTRGPSSQYYGVNTPLLGGGNQHNWRAGWTNIRHPKIKDLMNQYLVRYNRQLHLAKLLDTAGKRQMDLPMLLKFTHLNGCPFLCWNSTLGQCFYRECQYLRSSGYPSPNNITDDIANQGIKVFLKGSLARMHPGSMDGPCPLTPLHIEGKQNAISDMPSRSFGSSPAWTCNTNSELLTLINSCFPLPSNQSWTVYCPNCAVVASVISALQMMPFKLDAWRLLPKRGGHFGKIGAPTSNLCGWIHNYNRCPTTHMSGASTAIGNSTPVHVLLAYHGICQSRYE
jgi:hypothetical protein